MPRGRPSKYKPEFCETVRKLGAQGRSYTQMARDLGVAKSTMQDWEAAHPNFRVALKEAREAAQAWWEDLGMEMAQTGTGNPTAFIFQMKNRFRDDYRDKIDHAHKGDVSFVVQTGVPDREEETQDDED